ATSRATATSAKRGRSRARLERRRGRVTWTSCGGLADRVVAAGVSRVTARDPAHPHPAAAEEAVLVDCLLGVARARRLVAAARRKPREEDSIDPDGPDPDPLHEPA